MPHIGVGRSHVTSQHITSEPQAHLASLDGQELHLTSTEFKLLAYIWPAMPARWSPTGNCSRRSGEKTARARNITCASTSTNCAKKSSKTRPGHAICARKPAWLSICRLVSRPLSTTPAPANNALCLRLLAGFPVCTEGQDRPQGAGKAATVPSGYWPP